VNHHGHQTVTMDVWHVPHSDCVTWHVPHSDCVTWCVPHSDCVTYDTCLIQTVKWHRATFRLCHMTPSEHIGNIIWTLNKHWLVAGRRGAIVPCRTAEIPDRRRV